VAIQTVQHASYGRWRAPGWVGPVLNQDQARQRPRSRTAPWHLVHTCGGGSDFSCALNCALSSFSSVNQALVVAPRFARQRPRSRMTRPVAVWTRVRTPPYSIEPASGRPEARGGGGRAHSLRLALRQPGYSMQQVPLTGRSCLRMSAGAESVHDSVRAGSIRTLAPTSGPLERAGAGRGGAGRRQARGAGACALMGRSAAMPPPHPRSRSGTVSSLCMPRVPWVGCLSVGRP
jgi:hypothetical protein